MVFLKGTSSSGGPPGVPGVNPCCTFCLAARTVASTSMSRRFSSPSMLSQASCTSGAGKVIALALRNRPENLGSVTNLSGTVILKSWEDKAVVRVSVSSAPTDSIPLSIAEASASKSSPSLLASRSLALVKAVSLVPSSVLVASTISSRVISAMSLPRRFSRESISARLNSSRSPNTRLALVSICLRIRLSDII